MLLLHVSHQLWWLDGCTHRDSILPGVSQHLHCKCPSQDRNHFNVQGGPPRLCTHFCLCHTLLQHADLSKAHRWKYQALLIDLHMEKLFPMVLVGDFQLVDKIFPRMPGDSLLYNGNDLSKLQRIRFHVTIHQTEEWPTAESKGEKPQSSCTSAEMPSLTNKNGEPFKSRGKSPQTPLPKTSTDSPNRKSLHHKKCSPPSKEHHGSHNKDSHGYSSKHQDKFCSDKSSKDKESSKSPWKHAVSLL